MSSYEYGIIEFAGYLADVEKEVSKKLQHVVENFTSSRLDLPLKRFDDIFRAHNRVSRQLNKSFDPKKTDAVNLWKLCNVFSIMAVEIADAMKDTRDQLRKRIEKESIVAPPVAEKPKSSMRKLLDEYRPSRKLFTTEHQQEVYDEDKPVTKEKTSWRKIFLKEEKRTDKLARSNSSSSPPSEEVKDTVDVVKESMQTSAPPPTPPPVRSMPPLKPNRSLTSSETMVIDASSRPPRPPRPTAAALASAIPEHSLRHTDDSIGTASEDTMARNPKKAPNLTTTTTTTNNVVYKQKSWNPQDAEKSTTTTTTTTQQTSSVEEPPTPAIRNKLTSVSRQISWNPTSRPESTAQSSSVVYQNLPPRPPEKPMRPKLTASGSTSPEVGFTSPTISPMAGRRHYLNEVPPTLISIDTHVPTRSYYNTIDLGSNRNGAVFDDRKSYASVSSIYNPTFSNSTAPSSTSSNYTTSSSSTNNITHLDVEHSTRFPSLPQVFKPEHARLIKIDSDENLHNSSGQHRF